MVNKSNIGAGLSRNRGISKSKGYFLAFVDSDDYWHKDKLKKQINFMEKNNLSLTHTSYKIVDKNGITIMGESNILNKLPTSASNLYAKNVFNFVSNLYDKENGKININLEDEIIEKTLIK